MPNYGYIITSKQVASHGKKVGWMYKEEPTDSVDSGWRVFSGDESDSYSELAENFVIHDASTIIGIDPEIEKFLLMDVGTEVERIASGELAVVLKE